MGFQSVMSLVNIGGAALDVKQQWDTQKEQGKKPSLMGSIGRAAFNMALYEMPLTAPFMYARDLYEMGSAVGGAANKLWHAAPGAEKNFFEANFGGNFTDSDEAATMRRRGLAAIQSSRMNARTVLGSEARRLHR